MRRAVRAVQNASSSLIPIHSNNTLHDYEAGFRNTSGRNGPSSRQGNDNGSSSNTSSSRTRRTAFYGGQRKASRYGSGYLGLMTVVQTVILIVTLVFIAELDSERHQTLTELERRYTDLKSQFAKVVANKNQLLHAQILQSNGSAGDVIREDSDATESLKSILKSKAEQGADALRFAQWLSAEFTAESLSMLNASEWKDVPLKAQPGDTQRPPLQLDSIEFDFENHPSSPFRPYRPYISAFRDQTDVPLDPVISVITPVKDTEPQSLLDCANSILNGSLQQIEWILVDDGSHSFRTIDVLKAFQESSDPRIRLLQTGESTGLSAARNVGIAAAKSELLAFIDSDDMIEATYLEKGAWFLATHLDCTIVNAYSFGFGSYKQYLHSNGFHNDSAMLFQNMVTVHVIVRKEAVVQVQGFNETIVGGYEDWDLWIKLFEAGYTAYTMEEYLIWYRTSPPSARWPNIFLKERREEFKLYLRQRYHTVYDMLDSSPVKDGRPFLGFAYKRKPPPQFSEIDVLLPFENQLKDLDSSPRLLLITPWFELGGADKFNLDLLQGLTEKGWHTTVVATKQSSTTSKGSPMGRWAHLFLQKTPDVFVLSTFLEWHSIIRFLVYIITSRKINLCLIAHSEIGYMALPLLKALAPSVLFLDMVHMITPSWKNGGYAYYSAMNSDALDRTFASSKHVMEWLANHPRRQAIGRNRLATLYTGIDTQVYQRTPALRMQTREALGIKEDDTAVVLFVGRMESVKNPVLVVEILSMLKKNIEDKARANGYGSHQLNFHGVFVGDGPLLPIVKSYIIAKSLTNVTTVLGAKTSMEVRDIMSGCDIFIQPSVVEGISLALLEAMSMELFPLTTRVGGQGEAVEDPVGITIPVISWKAVKDWSPKNLPAVAKEFSDRLENLIFNLPSTRDYGRQARERVDRRFATSHMPTRFAGECSQAAMARATSIATTEESLHRNIQWAFSMLAYEDKVEYLQASLSEKKSVSDSPNSDRVMAHPGVEDSKQDSVRDVLAPLYVYPSTLLDAEWGEVVRVLSVGIIGANSIKRRGNMVKVPIASLLLDAEVDSLLLDIEVMWLITDNGLSVDDTSATLLLYQLVDIKDDPNPQQPFITSSRGKLARAQLEWSSVVHKPLGAQHAQSDDGQTSSSETYTRGQKITDRYTLSLPSKCVGDYFEIVAEVNSASKPLALPEKQNSGTSIDSKFTLCYVKIIQGQGFHLKEVVSSTGQTLEESKTESDAGNRPTETELF